MDEKYMIQTKNSYIIGDISAEKRGILENFKRAFSSDNIEWKNRPEKFDYYLEAEDACMKIIKSQKVKVDEIRIVKIVAEFEADVEIKVKSAQEIREG